MTTTLPIKDLPVTEVLGASAMRTVRGGSPSSPSFTSFMSLLDAVKLDMTLMASQLIGRTQNVVNMNGYNTAFGEGMASQVSSTQNAKNDIHR
jgi:hypothetical protein